MSQELSKPEWFQMVDADEIAPERKSRRAIRIMALASPLLLLGVGLVFAQTQSGPVETALASASPATASASPSTPVTASALPIKQTPQPTTAAAQTHASVQVSKPSTSAVMTGAKISFTKPGIKFPTGPNEQIIRTSDDE